MLTMRKKQILTLKQMMLKKNKKHHPLTIKQKEEKTEHEEAAIFEDNREYMNSGEYKSLGDLFNCKNWKAV